DAFPGVTDDVAGFFAVERVGRPRGEGFGDGHVRPQAAGQDDLEAAAETGSGAEDLPSAVLLDVAGVIEPDPLAVEVELQERGVRAKGLDHEITLKGMGRRAAAPPAPTPAAARRSRRRPSGSTRWRPQAWPTVTSPPIVRRSTGLASGVKPCRRNTARSSGRRLSSVPTRLSSVISSFSGSQTGRASSVRQSTKLKSAIAGISRPAEPDHTSVNGARAKPAIAWKTTRIAQPAFSSQNAASRSRTPWSGTPRNTGTIRLATPMIMAVTKPTVIAWR